MRGVALVVSVRSRRARRRLSVRRFRKRSHVFRILLLTSATMLCVVSRLVASATSGTYHMETFSVVGASAPTTGAESHAFARLHPRAHSLYKWDISSSGEHGRHNTPVRRVRARRRNSRQKTECTIRRTDVCVRRA